ncbi:MAG TPA: hypothetical protein VMZ53_00725 [Kofleriaceae bacterium]|nr:hypothetical protein [Kofleriaceae bacterium]
MRAHLWLVAILLAVPAVAHADETIDDEDGAFVPFPKRSVGLGLVIHGTRIGGESESGVGPNLELAIGRDRWQYIAEFSLSKTTRHSQSVDPSLDMGIEGKVIRGDIGVRWLARQFRPDSGGGIELFLLSALGAQRFYFSDGGRLSRPELAAGFGMQVRTYKRPRLAFRFDARILFTPNSNESSLVQCRGRCDMEAGASTGFITGFGFAW